MDNQDRYLQDLSKPITDKEYWLQRYGVYGEAPYSRKDFINDYYTPWDRIKNNIKQIGLSITHDIGLGSMAMAHRMVGSAAKEPWTNKEEKQRALQRTEEIERDLKTFYEIKNRNNVNFVNEATGSTLLNEAMLSLSKVGVHSFTGTVPMTTLMSSFGETYTSGLINGMSSDKAYWYGALSGGVAAGLEYGGGKFIKGGGAIIRVGLQEAAEEIEQGTAQRLIDMAFYGGKPPELMDEQDKPDWENYLKSYGKDMVMSAVLAFAVGAGMGAIQTKIGSVKKIKDEKKIQRQVQFTIDSYNQKAQQQGKPTLDNTTAKAMLTKAMIQGNNTIEQKRMDLLKQQLLNTNVIPDSSLAQPNTKIDAQQVSQLTRIRNSQILQELEYKQNKKTTQTLNNQNKTLLNKVNSLLTEKQKSIKEIDTKANKLEKTTTKQVTKLLQEQEKALTQQKVLKEKLKGFLNKIQDKTIRSNIKRLDLTQGHQRRTFLAQVKKLDNKSLLKSAEVITNQYKNNSAKLPKIEKKQEQLQNNYIKEVNKLNRSKKDADAKYQQYSIPIKEEIEGNNATINNIVSSNLVLKDNINGLIKEQKMFSRFHKDKKVVRAKEFDKELSGAKRLKLITSKNTVVNKIGELNLGLDALPTVLNMLNLDENSMIYKEFRSKVIDKRNLGLGICLDMQDQMYTIFNEYTTKTGKDFYQDLATEKTMEYISRKKASTKTTLKFTVSEMMEIYMKSKNQKALNRLIRGNKLSYLDIQTIINNLSPAQIEVADKIIAWYGQHEQDIASIKERTTGKRAISEENYTTLYSDHDYLEKNKVFDDTPSELDLVDLFDLEPKEKKSVQDRISKDRSSSSVPVNLDLITNMARFSQEASHYISFMEQIDMMTPILSSPALQEKHGESLKNYFREYIANIARNKPNFVQSPVWRLFRDLRINGTKYVLPFKMTTIAIQPISALAVWDRVELPILMNSIYKCATDHENIRAKMRRLDPKSYISGYDLSVDAMELRLTNKDINKLKKLSDTHAKVGFLLLKYGDKIGKTVAWEAAFTQAQKNNPLGTEQDWAKFASEAISETQPTTYVEDLPPLYYQEWFRSIAAFSNQRLKYYNRIISDVSNKKLSPIKAIERITKGVLLPQLLITLVQSGGAALWNTDDKDRWNKLGLMYMNNLVGLHPFINLGISLSQYSSLGNNIFALSGPQKTIQSAWGLARNAVNRQELDTKKLRQLSEGVGQTFGVPIDYLFNIGDGLQENIEQGRFNLASYIYNDWARKRYFQKD